MASRAARLLQLLDTLRRRRTPRPAPCWRASWA
jgi:hypothetical protein